MILLSAHVFSIDVIKEGEDGDQMMFYTHLIIIFLFFFNILFTLTWVISLFIHITNFKKSIIILITIYAVCIAFFFTLPLLYSV